MSIQWKDGRKAAFAFGFDLDGATIWRNKAYNMPNGRTFIKGPSIGEYGLKVGALRILEIMDRYGFQSTWFIPAENFSRCPELIETILKKGHELGHHGYDHRGEYGRNSEEQIEYIQKCQEIFIRFSGSPAHGFRSTGPLLEETRRWMFTEGGFLYSSSELCTDECGYYELSGQQTNGVNIPCLEQMMDDYLQTAMHNYPHVLVNMPRIAPYRNPYRNWIREIEALVRYGGAGSPAFHPQVSGTPGRALMLERLCQYLTEHEDEVWTTTCLNIARHFRASKEVGIHA